jgi:hypothetical protein
MPSILRVMSNFGILDIEVLRDANATSSNIKKGLNALIQDAKGGDVRIFYISSHGTLLPPQFSGSDDADGRDEAIVPYEGTLSSLITDNWIAEFLRTIVPADVSFWAIYDCCHSGDLFKDAIIAGLVSEAEAAAQQKQVEFNNLIIDTLPARLAVGNSDLTTKRLVLDENITSFHFGAAEPERAALCMPINGINRSVFTCALEEVIRPDQTVAQFEVAVTAKMATITTAHIPQIACSDAQKNRILFT